MKNILSIIVLFLTTQNFIAQEQSTNTGPFVFVRTDFKPIKLKKGEDPNLPRGNVFVEYDGIKIFIERAVGDLSNAWTKPNKKKNELARAMVFFGGGGQEYCIKYSNNAIKVYRKYIETGDSESTAEDLEFKDELIKTIPLNEFTSNTKKAIQEINKHLGKK